MLAFSNDYYGFIFRVTQSVELFCTYRIASITHLYENTQILIKWLEQSDEVVKNVNNVFYEYDTDKSEECK